MRMAMVAGLAAAMLAAPVAAQALEAGLWEVVTTPVIGGMAGPPQGTMRCLTADDVKDLEKTFSPVARTVNSPCNQVEKEFTPERLKWRLQCRGQLDMDVSGEFLFQTPLRYTAKMTTRASLGDQVVQESSATIEARHTGPCPAP
jgi:hypothetical protein